MPATQAVKRKKTADMTDSPPKRVTRARAKNTDTDNVASKPKSTKITTASAKAAAMKKKPGILNEAIRRKTRAHDEDGEAIEEAVLEQEAKAEPTKVKGRAKKAVLDEKEEDQMPDAPKTRARPTKAPAAEVSKPEASKTRGRPKKTFGTASAAPEAREDTEKLEPVIKTTRGRPATNAMKKPSVASATRLTAPAQKKSVKFQPEPDKENVPIKTEGSTKSALKPTGLKAKPVRKPAAARAITRGRKAAVPTAQSQELGQKDILPLSPKKINQVAKSDPMISEDELAGEKTPVRALSKSPVKRLMSPVKDFGSVSKLNFDQVTAPSSPSRPTSSSILGSPARRPPPSPFKDALKSSPKKVQLGDSIAQPVLLPSRTPMKVSLLQDSPRRGHLGDNMTQPILLPSKSPFKMSLLQQSPKRVKIEDEATQLIVRPSKPLFKASLLQSPVRRPATSTMKSTGLGSPVKSGMEAPVSHAAIALGESSSPKAPNFSPEKVISSPFRAARSPEQTAKNHTITDEECKVDANDEDRPAFHGESPTMDIAAEVESPSRNPVPTFEEPVSFDDTIIIDQSEPITSTDDTLETSKNAETPTVFKGPAFSLASAALRRVSIESGSEDELASPEKGYGVTPLRRHGVTVQDFSTPAVIDSDISEDQLSFSPLADQLSSWAASSPNKQNATSRSRRARGMFSLGDAGMIVAPEQIIGDIRSPAKSSFFEDEMVMRDGEVEVEDASIAEMDVGNEQDLAALQASQESQASEEYGDENAMPSDAEILRAEQDHTLTCTPAKVFTPAKKISQHPREIHTVSKVPLRASAEDSPLIMTRPRSRSFGGPLSVVHDAHQDSTRQSVVPGNAENENVTLDQPATPVLVATMVPQTPGSAMRLDAETPGRTVRKGVVPDVLKGAVVFVDVHTSEGADASGIFVDLLTQMGARCVKQWSWNPRASTGSSVNNNTPHASSPDTTKVGITHLVYKDGGKRTLEKVRSSNGVVLCVGVGWVLDCEREDKWLDEADYAIDTSMIPRGGSRRRKSMEPRALANMNGNLIPASIETPARVSPETEMSPTQEFLTFDTPASRRDTFIIERQTPQEQESTVPPATPIPASGQDDMLEDGSAWGSPTTPYYLSKGAELVQRTCPPKQMGFPVSGEIDDQPDETVRRRLMEARRKSMQWASRIRSPLGRTVSYGK
ncbi:MAG: hypothetical protein ASARMPRED_003182 [Alectoria sarmentosa]|nr:MAG: hypothetical protein ASARMPRED_003182 [Alectoria sarmentosa]